MIIELKEKWFKIPRWLRFLVIGGINTVMAYVFFALFIMWLGEKNYQIAVVLMWGCSSVISFMNQKMLVFNTRGNYFKEYVKCCMTWGIDYVINAMMIAVAVEVWKFNVYWGQLISLIITTIVSYCLFKYFAFRQKE